MDGVELMLMFARGSPVLYNQLSMDILNISSGFCTVDFFQIKFFVRLHGDKIIVLFVETPRKFITESKFDP
jgi:hypothetical protein